MARRRQRRRLIHTFTHQLASIARETNTRRACAEAWQPEFATSLFYRHGRVRPEAIKVPPRARNAFTYILHCVSSAATPTYHRVV